MASSRCERSSARSSVCLNLATRWPAPVDVPASPRRARRSSASVTTRAERSVTGSRAVFWLHAATSPASVIGYWSGVARAFSASAPATRASTASSVGRGIGTGGGVTGLKGKGQAYLAFHLLQPVQPSATTRPLRGRDVRVGDDGRVGSGEGGEAAAVAEQQERRRGETGEGVGEAGFALGQAEGVPRGRPDDGREHDAPRAAGEREDGVETGVGRVRGGHDLAVRRGREGVADGRGERQRGRLDRQRRPAEGDEQDALALPEVGRERASRRRSSAPCAACSASARCSAPPDNVAGGVGQARIAEERPRRSGP